MKRNRKKKKVLFGKVKITNSGFGLTRDNQQLPQSTIGQLANSVFTVGNKEFKIPRIPRHIRARPTSGRSRRRFRGMDFIESPELPKKRLRKYKKVNKTRSRSKRIKRIPRTKATRDRHRKISRKIKYDHDVDENSSSLEYDSESSSAKSVSVLSTPRSPEFGPYSSSLESDGSVNEKINKIVLTDTDSDVGGKFKKNVEKKFFPILISDSDSDGNVASLQKNVESDYNEDMPGLIEVDFLNNFKTCGESDRGKNPSLSRGNLSSNGNLSRGNHFLTPRPKEKYSRGISNNMMTPIGTLTLGKSNGLLTSRGTLTRGESNKLLTPKTIVDIEKEIYTESPSFENSASDSDDFIMKEKDDLSNPWRGQKLNNLMSHLKEGDRVKYANSEYGLKKHVFYRLLVEDFKREWISNVPPFRPMETSLYIYDLMDSSTNENGILTHKDLLCDGMGSIGKHEGSHQISVKVEETGKVDLNQMKLEAEDFYTRNNVAKKERFAVVDEDNKCLLFCKTISKFSCDVKIRRITVRLGRRVLIFYYYEDKHKFPNYVVKTHGNSKRTPAKKRKYQRKSESLMKEMKSMLTKNMKPNQVHKNLKSSFNFEKGNFASYPRDIHSVRYQHKKLKKEEKIKLIGKEANLMSDLEYLRMKNRENLDKRVVHDIRICGENGYSILLTTKNSLLRLVSCCTGRIKTPLAIDVSFEYTKEGHLAIVGYFKIKFLNKDPCNIAYIELCFNHRKEEFLSTLLAVNALAKDMKIPKHKLPEKIKYYAGDFEVAIEKAVRNFGLSTIDQHNVFIFGGKHFLDICKRWIDEGKKTGQVNKDQAQYFMNDFFGDFNILSGDELRFYELYHKEKNHYGEFLMKKVQKNLIDKLRIPGLTEFEKKKAGYSMYTGLIGNDNYYERANRVVKDYLNNRKSIKEVVALIEDIFKCQDHELLASIIEEGEFRLKEEYEHLKGDKRKLLMLGPAQKNDYLNDLKHKLFLSSNLEDTNTMYLKLKELGLELFDRNDLEKICATALRILQSTDLNVIKIDHEDEERYAVIHNGKSHNLQILQNGLVKCHCENGWGKCHQSQDVGNICGHSVGLIFYLDDESLLKRTCTYYKNHSERILFKHHKFMGKKQNEIKKFKSNKRKRERPQNIRKMLSEEAIELERFHRRKHRKLNPQVTGSPKTPQKDDDSDYRPENQKEPTKRKIFKRKHHKEPIFKRADHEERSSMRKNFKRKHHEEPIFKRNDQIEEQTKREKFNVNDRRRYDQFKILCSSCGGQVDTKAGEGKGYIICEFCEKCAHRHKPYNEFKRCYKNINGHNVCRNCIKKNSKY